ncbi:AsnC family transcriptional regulator [Brenneria alni]|uniref:AsnC family transcriptional regulator n=1 Tax=Brenneria alni TaxID=71656 RepID=A0A421DJ10_9GAMM|nr:Lrp/AsnC family transcriptional regulator [Brenneria alni]RLM18073.1 AsnC family transcriptional regulator [Brenneria alni]
MNETDQQIITLLRENARMSVTEISTRIKVSRATVQKRMEHLEKEGIISGYTIRIKPENEKNRIHAWMSIAVEGARQKSILQELRWEPAVYSLHTTNGKWDILAEIRTDNLESFNHALGHIRGIVGISCSETSILLSTYKA